MYPRLIPGFLGVPGSSSFRALTSSFVVLGSPSQVLGSSLGILCPSFGVSGSSFGVSRFFARFFIRDSRFIQSTMFVHGTRFVVILIQGFRFVVADIGGFCLQGAKGSAPIWAPFSRVGQQKHPGPLAVRVFRQGSGDLGGPFVCHVSCLAT